VTDAASTKWIPELRRLAFPIDQLREDPGNARTHDERNVEAVRASLARFGWRGVVVARRKDRTILAGHARVQAARLLGWTEAPVLFVSEARAKSIAFAIADNRSAELADWDVAKLTAQLAVVADDPELLASVGFSEDEMRQLLAGIEAARPEKNLMFLRWNGLLDARQPAGAGRSPPAHAQGR